MFSHRKIFAGVFAGLFLVLAQPTSAQSPIRQELDGLRQQAQLLVAQASNLQPGPRADQIEEQLRFLTGQIEAFEFRLRQLEQGDAGLAAGQQTFQTPVQTQTPLPDEAPIGGQTVLGAPPSDLGQLRVDAQGDPLNITGAGQYSPGDATSQTLPPEAVPVQSAQGQPAPAQPAPAPQAGSQLAVAPPTGPDGARDDYDSAYELVLRGDYPGARDAFASFLNRHPSHELSPNANFWIGETHYQEGNYKSAARAYLDTSQRYPQAAKAPESLLKLGLSLSELEQRSAACSTFKQLLTKYPRSEAGLRSRAQNELNSLGC